MPLDEKLKTELTKRLYEIVNEIVQSYVSEQVRIKYRKEVLLPLAHQLHNAEIMIHDINLNRTAYEILMSTRIFDGKYRYQRRTELITTKTKWNEFYRNLQQSP